MLEVGEEAGEEEEEEMRRGGEREQYSFLLSMHDYFHTTTYTVHKWAYIPLTSPAPSPYFPRVSVSPSFLTFSGRRSVDRHHTSL